MFQRPKPGEGEQDILRMQAEFLRNKRGNTELKPAAQVVDVRGQSAGDKRSSVVSETRKQSKYAQDKGLSSMKRPKTESLHGLIGDIVEKNTSEDTAKHESDNIYFPNISLGIVKDVIEKNCSSEVPLPKFSSDLSSKGFPVVSKRDLKLKPGQSSVFAQQLSLNRNKDLNMDVDLGESSHFGQDTGINLPCKSFIISSEDADYIHNQNTEILKNISEKEILEEQKKLMATLDPRIIQLMRSKREVQLHTTETGTEDIRKMEAQSSVGHYEKQLQTSQQITDSLWENDILSDPNLHRYVNFNSLEKDKLEWMKSIQENKIKNGDEPYEARFDFKGYLLPYTLEYNEKTKTLFHHGEEAHRPGYSLLELFELSRSSIIQQRVMALNTLAGILQYYITGIYKDVIDIPITKIFFVLRIALDENKTATLEPALRALRNLIYFAVDESCLDALLGTEEGLKQPNLMHDKVEIEELDSKETDLRDFHLAEIDLISAALRTDILQRIQYILNVMKPSFNCVHYCLQILTRLVRESSETAHKIVNLSPLITCIVQNFLPVTGINFLFDVKHVYNGKPVLAAIKFLRVLSLQSPEIALILSSKYSILEAISAYVSSGIDSTYGLKIQSESFALLTNYVSQAVGTGHILSLSPLLLVSLHKHVNSTDIHINSSLISVTHASVLIELISQILKLNHEIIPQCCSLIMQGLTKWLTQLSSSETYSCGHLKLLCATFDCIRSVIEMESSTSRIGKLENLLQEFASASGFKAMVKQLISSSNLLSQIGNSQINSIKNLNALGCTIIGQPQKVLPVLNFKSPVLFLLSLLKLVNCLDQSALSALYIVQLTVYLREIRCQPLFLCENWFTRIETDLLFCVIKAMTINPKISENEKDLLYAISNRMCYILRSDKHNELNYLLTNIIFDKNWFTIQQLLNMASVNDVGLFTRTMMSIEEIRTCYFKIINIQSNCSSQMSIDINVWQNPILPRDWIYLPIVKLYSENQEPENVPKISTKKTELSEIADKSFIVSCCLEWIVFNELCFVDLTTDIDLTDRFCRLLCIFLCDNSLFLDEKIKSLIEKSLKIMFKQEKSCPFDFDKELTGLHNFQDFYTQLLQQFQAVSYGDTNFSACILVPLAQRHNVRWRKIVWSEYAGCLRALECAQDKLCYELNDYLYPEETDESVIKCYLRALSSSLLRPDTIPFKIAKHHVSSFRVKHSNNEIPVKQMSV